MLFLRGKVSCGFGRSECGAQVLWLDLVRRDGPEDFRTDGKRNLILLDKSKLSWTLKPLPLDRRESLSVEHVWGIIRNNNYCSSKSQVKHIMLCIFRTSDFKTESPTGQKNLFSLLWFLSAS